MYQKLDNIAIALDGLQKAGGNGKQRAIKTVTFANTAVDEVLFVVTGTVIVRLIAVCKTNVASAGGCNIGVDCGAAAMIADTDCTLLAAGEIWHDATPDAVAELITVMKEYVICGTNIVLDVETAKQVDSGVIDFYCVYAPLSADGSVA